MHMTMSLSRRGITWSDVVVRAGELAELPFTELKLLREAAKPTKEQSHEAQLRLTSTVPFELLSRRGGAEPCLADAACSESALYE